jgi:hypothetical protein
MEGYKEDNLKETESEDVDWIQLALVNMVMHLGVA